MADKHETTIQARYDPKEDRMVLSVLAAGDEGQTRHLNFTRRQWIGLLHQVVVLKLASLDDSKPRQPPPAASTPAVVGKPKPLPPMPEAQRIQTLQLRQDADGVVRILCGVSDKDVVTVAVNKVGMTDVLRMLEQQAERAGWDPRAAIERLEAGTAAAQAMKKAQGGGQQ